VKVSARRREGHAHDLQARHHTFVADEPEEEGGTDTGPSPTELLALSLASCTAITIEMYAGRKGWELGAVEVEVEQEKLAPDRRRFDVLIKVPEPLSDEQAERLCVIAGKCPVHRALLGQNEINDRIETG
jgi:putative redox protein